jgi:hypothetical protein
MSSFGLIEENMELSHIHLAVKTYYYLFLSFSNNVLFLGSCRRSNNKNIEVDLCPRHPHQHPLQVKVFFKTFCFAFTLGLLALPCLISIPS